MLFPVKNCKKLPSDPYKLHDCTFCSNSIEIQKNICKANISKGIFEQKY